MIVEPDRRQHEPRSGRSREFLGALRALCTTARRGADLRRGHDRLPRRRRSGAQGLFGITPDLTTLGKVIGGGLPVGAFGGRRDIMAKLAPLGPVYQAGTLSGNPVAVAAGLATLELVLEPGFFDRLARARASLVEGLRAAASGRRTLHRGACRAGCSASSSAPRRPRPSPR